MLFAFRKVPLHGGKYAEKARSAGSGAKTLGFTRFAETDSNKPTAVFGAVYGGKEHTGPDVGLNAGEGVEADVFAGIEPVPFEVVGDECDVVGDHATVGAVGAKAAQAAPGIHPSGGFAAACLHAVGHGAVQLAEVVDFIGSGRLH